MNEIGLTRSVLPLCDDGMMRQMGACDTRSRLDIKICWSFVGLWCVGVGGNANE